MCVFTGCYTPIISHHTARRRHFVPILTTDIDASITHTHTHTEKRVGERGREKMKENRLPVDNFRRNKMAVKVCVCVCLAGR
jgi:hypothetical protein